MNKKNKVLVEKLVSLSRYLGVDQIVDVLLVVAGFKPAALVDISYRKNKFSTKVFQNKIDEFKDVLDGFGISYKIVINNLKKENQATHYSYVAQDKRRLSQLIRANGIKNLKKRRIYVGKILGYPLTAVEAFSENKSIENNDLPKHIRNKVWFPFLKFRLSSNWRGELSYVREISKTIKKASPDLYKKVVGSL